MKVIADQDLAEIKKLLSDHVELTLLPGREITADAARGQDAILVRSITPINGCLLANSNIRFVGTATSGLDHIDQRFLETNNIALAHAAGSNADAVVDYCLSAMAEFGLFQKTRSPCVGIIGVGEVGGRLFRRLNGMGIRCKLVDPFIEAATDKKGAFSRLEALAECDAVSVHVPLTSSGEYPTAGMIDEAFLGRMGADSILLHTARGGVVDEQALLNKLVNEPQFRCALDVWRNEPAVNSRLANASTLATPHIAGYSARAKIAASTRIVSQLLAFKDGVFSSENTSDYGYPGLSQGDLPAWPARAAELVSIFPLVFDISALSQRFKAAVNNALESGLEAHVFDGFRRELRTRAEFGDCISAGLKEGGVIEPESLSASERQFLSAAGFDLKPIAPGPS